MADGMGYEKGLAFIVEGATERVFYEEYLMKLCADRGMQISENVDTQENSFIITNDNKSIMVMVNNVGSITQMTNSATWLRRACFNDFKETPWHVFLCYDTDNYDVDITKFYKGDWLRLRNTIEKDATTVTDLAARADIEDIMLCDYAGVLDFLGLNPETEMPNGHKGKVKMKKLFRKVAVNNAYHEGRRARSLIRALDMDVIKAKAPIPLETIDNVLGF